MSISMFKWLLAGCLLAVSALVYAGAPSAAPQSPKQTTVTIVERSAPQKLSGSNTDAGRSVSATSIALSADKTAGSSVEWKVRSVKTRGDQIATTQHSEPLAPAPLPAPAPVENDLETGLLQPAFPPPLPIARSPLAAPGAVDPISAYPGYTGGFRAGGVSGNYVHSFGNRFPCRLGHRRCARCGKPTCCGEPYAGFYLQRAMNVQIVNTLANQLVLYHYDFEQGDRASQLSLRGRQQLAKYAPRALVLGRPIVIEPTPWLPAVDEARRDNVIQALTQLDPSASQFWADGHHVVVALPWEPGLRAQEALYIDGNLLDRTRSGSTLESSTGGMNSGASAMPFPTPMF